MARPVVPYEVAVHRAALVMAAARDHMATLTPEQAAAEAYLPGGPSREELAQRIRERRAETLAATRRAA